MADPKCEYWSWLAKRNKCYLKSELGHEMKGNNIFLTAKKSCNINEENSTITITTNRTTVTESTMSTDSTETTTLSTNSTTMFTNSTTLSPIDINVNLTTTSSYNVTSVPSTTNSSPMPSNTTLSKNSSCKFDEIFQRLQNNLSKVRIEIIEEKIVPSTTTKEPYLFLAALNSSDYKDFYDSEIQ